MKTLMKDDGGGCAVFTGINAYFSRGDFNSIEGVPLSKIVHKWAKYEPDNYNDQEQYLMMLPSGELADVNGTEPLPYFCYKKSLSTNDCGTINPGYQLDTRTGSCYKFHSVPRIWSRAFMTCTAEGGYLAIINSETESQVIREIFAKNPSGTLRSVYKGCAFVGFHDLWEHGEFLTVKGQTLRDAGFDKFVSNQPNNLTPGQFCGGVERDGKYNDLFCEAMLHFICEKDPESVLICQEEF